MKDNSGPAFPVPNSANVNNQEGMTLRDYFAGQVLCGITTVTGVDFGSPFDAAKTCYRLADAMLEARK